MAAALGMAPRSVRRWERSEAAVPEERLDALCRLLSVTAAERLSLSQRRLWLGETEWEKPLSLEAAEQQCERLFEQAHRGDSALIDLRLLSLEAQLWPQAARSAAARRVLAYAFTTHAQYLLLTGRRGEVAPYSDRAMELVVGQCAPERWWFRAVHATGAVMTPYLDGGLRHRHRIEFLRRWLDLTDDRVWQTGLYRDMAQYSAESGHYEAALGWIGTAEMQAERINPLSLHLTKHIHSKALLAAGRPKAALLKLPSSEAGLGVHQQLYDANQRVEALLALGDHAEAQDWLSHAYTLCREHGLSPDRVNDLARRF